MLTVRHIRFLLRLQQTWPDTGFFVVGDYGQLPAVDPIPDGRSGLTMHPGQRKLDEHSQALLTLCRGNRHTLTEFHRGDRALYEICLRVRAGKDVAADIMGRPGASVWAIAFLHSSRLEWNEQAEQAFVGTKQSVTIEKNPRDGHSQKVRVCYGYPLVARRAAKLLGIKKADRLTVIKCTQSQLELRLEDEAKLKKDRLKLTVDAGDFHKYFRPGFCVTLYQAQGATFRFAYTILDWYARNKRTGKLHMGPRERYVAVSRGVELKSVAIAQ